MRPIYLKAKVLLHQKKYFWSFFISTIFYVLLSLFLIRYFYISFDLFFKQGGIAYADLFVMLLIAFLFGINMMFVSYTFSNLKTYANQAGTGIFSSVIGLFIAGCPACSLTLISLIVPYIGALISLPVFPLHGLEIQLFGLLLMMISLFFVSKDLTCDIKLP